MQVKTLNEAIYNDSMSLVSLKLNLKEQTFQAFMVEILTDLVMSFNIGKTMNENQIVEAVEIIGSEYYFLKPTELKYCFQKAKTGKYGVVYDRIDLSIICGWIDSYMDERLTETIKTQQNEQKAHRIEFYDELLTLVKPIVDNLTKIEKKENIPIIHEKTEKELTFQYLLKEFDRLYQNQENSDGGLRIVSYNNKNLTQSEYVLMRINEPQK